MHREQASLLAYICHPHSSHCIHKYCLSHFSIVFLTKQSLNTTHLLELLTKSISKIAHVLLYKELTKTGQLAEQEQVKFFLAKAHHYVGNKLHFSHFTLPEIKLHKHRKMKWRSHWEAKLKPFKTS